MVSPLAKKRWPADAVVIVSATPERLVASGLRGVAVQTCCFECGCRLLADSFTIERGASPKIGRGRPIKFLCDACCESYDMSTITYCEDHRR